MSADDRVRIAVSRLAGGSSDCPDSKKNPDPSQRSSDSIQTLDLLRLFLFEELYADLTGEEIIPEQYQP